jgi:hypothetical protein
MGYYEMHTAYWIENTEGIILEIRYVWEDKKLSLEKMNTCENIESNVQ